MKIAISAQGRDLDAAVDARFGRAPFFVVVDTETAAVSVVDNARNLGAAQGAGIQAARTVVDSGVSAVVTGNVGPKAFVTLQAGGVQVYLGAGGLVREALEQFREGKLRCASEANVDSHWV